MKRFDQAWLVAKRELIDQMRDWRILLPMIVLTLFFPFLMNVAAKGTINYVNQYGANLIAERLLPFLILVVGYFPVTVSLVVALEAFVGEKERGTIEPLLTSPLADEHLYLGKLMAGTIFPLTVSFIGITLYMGGLLWQGIKWPEWGFILQTLALTVVQTLLMVSAAIVISTQSTTVRAANLLASFIVIPVALLIQGESALMFWGTNDILWWAVIGVGIMSGLVIRLGLVHFKRESLLGREIDVLSLSWIWQTFQTALTGSNQASGMTRYLRCIWLRQRGRFSTPHEPGPISDPHEPGPISDPHEPGPISDPHEPGLISEQIASENISFTEAVWMDWNGLKRWYRVEVTLSLRRLAPTLWLTLAIGIVSVLIAYFYVDTSLPPKVLSDNNLRESLKAVRGFLLDDGSGGFSFFMLFWHNLRAELIILGLGIFSFGVLSTIALIGNFALIGGVLGAVRLVGISPGLVFFAGILPHGIVELPSVILLSAAVLHMGLRLVTPEEGSSIGETMIVTFADVVKLLLAICIPLLVIAALIEANITPRILLAAFGHSLDNLP